MTMARMRRQPTAIIGRNYYGYNYNQLLTGDGNCKAAAVENKDICTKGKTYVQEMEELKDAFKDGSDDENDELFVPKEKSSEEKAKEDADYRAWLAGQV